MMERGRGFSGGHFEPVTQMRRLEFVLMPPFDEDRKSSDKLPVVFSLPSNPALRLDEAMEESPTNRREYRGSCDSETESLVEKFSGNELGPESSKSNKDLSDRHNASTSAGHSIRAGLRRSLDRIETSTNTPQRSRGQRPSSGERSQGQETSSGERSRGQRPSSGDSEPVRKSCTDRQNMLVSRLKEEREREEERQVQRQAAQCIINAYNQVYNQAYNEKQRQTVRMRDKRINKHTEKDSTDINRYKVDDRRSDKNDKERNKTADKKAYRELTLQELLKELTPDQHRHIKSVLEQELNLYNKT